MVSLLLEEGADPRVAVHLSKGSSAEVFYPFYWAAMDGWEEVCEAMMDKGADPDMGVQRDGGYTRSPLEIAGENGHKSVCALLRARGATG